MVRTRCPVPHVANLTNFSSFFLITLSPERNLTYRTFSSLSFANNKCSSREGGGRWWYCYDCHDASFRSCFPGSTPSISRELEPFDRRRAGENRQVLVSVGQHFCGPPRVWIADDCCNATWVEISLLNTHFFEFCAEVSVIHDSSTRFFNISFFHFFLDLTITIQSLIYRSSFSQILRLWIEQWSILRSFCDIVEPHLSLDFPSYHCL